MPYVIHESSKMPARQSYDGPLTLPADITGGQVYADKRQALKDAKKLGDGFSVSPRPDSEPLPFDLTQPGD